VTTAAGRGRRIISRAPWGALLEAGIRAHGIVGSDDPIEAADDALRQFPADELVFATHPEARANWLERDVVQVARTRYEVPTTHVDVGD
jgi:hypothetical protein